MPKTALEIKLGKGIRIHPVSGRVIRGLVACHFQRVDGLVDEIPVDDPRSTGNRDVKLAIPSRI